MRQRAAVALAPSCVQHILGQQHHLQLPFSPQLAELQVFSGRRVPMEGAAVVMHCCAALPRSGRQGGSATALARMQPSHSARPRIQKHEIVTNKHAVPSGHHSISESESFKAAGV